MKTRETIDGQQTKQTKKLKVRNRERVEEGQNERYLFTRFINLLGKHSGELGWADTVGIARSTQNNRMAYGYQDTSGMKQGLPGNKQNGVVRQTQGQFNEGTIYQYA